MLRLGFVGLGWWGRELAAAVGRAGRHLVVVRGFSPVAAERDAFAREFGASPCGDLGAILAAAEVDAVVLATPHSLHAAQIEAAARAGKHVFVEKPLCLSVAEGERALDACRRQGVALAVGHNRRLLAGPALIKDMIAAGRLGTVLHVEAGFSTREGLALGAGHWRASASESLGGPLAPLGIHVIDWLHWLFGRVERAAATLGRRARMGELPDTATALLRFEAGITGCLTAIYATPYASRLAVQGTGGSATLEASAPDSPEMRPSLVLKSLDGREERIPVPWVDTLALQLERFAAAVDGRGASAVSGGEALDNVAVMEAVLAAAESGAWERPRYPARRP